VNNDWYSSPSCLDNFFAKDCAKNSKRFKKVVMIGDSHTQQDFTIFNQIALKYSFTAIEVGRTGCPFILPWFLSSDLENKFTPYFNYKKCLKENSNLISWLKRNHIRNIILNSADSGQYITQITRNKNAHQSWIIGISRSAKFLQQSIPDSRVVILGPNPAMNSESRFPLTKLSIFQHLKPPRESIPFAEFSNTAFEDSRIFTGFEFSHRFLFLPTYQNICGKESCLNMKNGHFVFSDGSHLTRFGAILLVPEFSTALRYFSQVNGL
jgi:hypothetical protein